MDLDGLLVAIRDELAPRAWAAAVLLAREGAVRGVSIGDDEVQLQVKDRQGMPHTVWLFPDDEEWECDCGIPGSVCVHVAAAAISLHQSGREGLAMPAPKHEYQVQLRYVFQQVKSDLKVHREVVSPDGGVSLLEGTLAESALFATQADALAESLLVTAPLGPLPADTLRRLIAQLDGREVMLDGAVVRVSNEPVLFRVRVTEQEGGFRVGLFRPPALDALYRGAALLAGELRPTSHGSLRPDQRRQLVQGVSFRADQVGRLVGEILPRLAEQIPVDIETDRLPSGTQLEPRVRLHLAEVDAGLEVRAEVAYGEPAVAVVRNGALQALGDVHAARDIGAERRVAREYEEWTGLPVDYRHVLSPSRAAAFLSEVVAGFKGEVVGKVRTERYRIERRAVRPEIQVRPVQGGGGFTLDVSFSGERGSAEARDVLVAWQSKRPLVALREGGFAPLPEAWLTENAPLLLELLESRDERGRVHRNATAALMELLEGTEAQIPPDLERLKRFLEGGEGLPEVFLPSSFRATLRPYQVAGLQWLGFLRDMELSGILADDMGLGKTVQTLAIMASTPGPHLVVAPTSVLTNWEREAQRFAPSLRVSLFHGPRRELDLGADIVLTSYALLRLDQELLGAHDWNWVVLDEAQAIKNPSSQTAQAAFALAGRHRLALSGTPVENRLEELWSLFRFLMPGLLGTLSSFKERFSRPIEAGDPRASKLLRARIRPYVLRRLKRNVAAELPPLTEIVVQCSMAQDQQRIYDATRAAGRAEVQRMLSERGSGAVAFSVLEALLRMRQAACDPALVPGVGDEVSSCKLDRLEEMLLELVTDDHKVLIFSQWTGLLDRVEPRLRSLGVPWVRLDGSTRDRAAVVDRFQDPEGPPVFLISLKAGGTGLNLTAADYVIHLDPWWNPAVEQQATDRAHRIGQDKPVVSCRLVAEGSVEEQILVLQESKRNLAEAAIGGEAGMLRALTADELRSLFDL
ncbi:MAG: SNF2 helicase associated domain-containing protein [Deltaproteobacteria bacterium]|nr:SNF2 helicase associated domain-containing protein [Deltaproteobacteria bacterium]